MNVTGKPAQFGRGVLADVSSKLIDQFATCLAGEILAGTPDPAAASDASTGTGTSGPAAPRVVPEAQPIDLLGTAGSPVLKRLAPVLAGLVALVLLVRRLRR
jgi:hypothetical protein